ncbi:LysR family transcriptional regulator [uncultured Cardiobacterium sp.]|uniref:LysR family transcriptional regulator n=1 Tax=uncultured Cardiobacterium sp. TaxID=417619 RepID=UPI00260944AE|nr:LysR family transcriptional regulator [uncultured Cardiobacterium sp.]
MDTLFSLKVFQQIVECASFTRAAESLGISTAMASKHLHHLEKHLGVRLMQRNSRRLSLTAEGESYYRQSGEALALLDNAAAAAGGGRETPQGHLRLTAPIWCANPTFAAWMRDYRARYPDVSLDLILDNEMRDLIGDGIDLALRVSRDPAPSLVVRPLFAVRFVLVAAPAWIRRHGLPQTPEDAAAHAAVLPSYTDLSRHPCTRGDTTTTLQLTSALQSNSTLMLRELLLAGSGIGYLPHWLAQDDLAAGRLVQLLPEWELHRITLHAAYPDRRHLSAKVRSFIDFLVEKAAALQDAS